jgi:serine/threonine-protein kinase
VATVGYLAPERLAGEPASSRSDLYSVGVVLYEALSGRRAFTGDSPVAVMLAVDRGQTEPLSNVAPAVPPALASVVDRAMAQRPEDRYASAREMSQALRRAQAGATAPTPAAALVETVPVPIEQTRASPRPARPSHGELHQAGPRRTPRVAGAIIGAVIAVVLVAGLTRGHDNAPRTPTSKSTSTNRPTTTTLPRGLEHALRQLEEAIGG